MSENKRKFIRLKEVDSTNDFLKRSYRDLPDGCVAIAERQFGGKGSRGRKFFSEKGGLYASILLKPPYKIDVDMLTPLAAAAVMKALRSFNCPDLSIKWVNDVLSQGKKICGILCESVVTEGVFDCVIVGIGINVCPPENGFDSSIKDSVASLYSERIPGAVDSVEKALLNAFFTLYENGNEAEISEFYAKNSYLNGKLVTVSRGNETFHGKCAGFNAKCNIILKTENGEVTLSSGSVVTYE